MNVRVAVEVLLLKFAVEIQVFDHFAAFEALKSEGERGVVEVSF